MKQNNKKDHPDKNKPDKRSSDWFKTSEVPQRAPLSENNKIPTKVNNDDPIIDHQTSQTPILRRYSLSQHERMQRRWDNKEKVSDNDHQSQDIKQVQFDINSSEELRLQNKERQEQQQPKLPKPGIYPNLDSVFDQLNKDMASHVRTVSPEKQVIGQSLTGHDLHQNPGFMEPRKYDTHETHLDDPTPNRFLSEKIFLVISKYPNLSFHLKTNK